MTQLLYESAESMARSCGIHPSKVIERLNSFKPQCPVHLQTLRFKPWQPPPPAGVGDVADEEERIVTEGEVVEEDDEVDF